MNTTSLKGTWKEMAGKIKQKWAKLTDDDLKAVEGNAEELQGRLQKTYGYSKERAQKEFEDFKKGIDAKDAQGGIQ